MRALATPLAVLAALLALPASALATDDVRVEPEGATARTLNLSALGDPDVQAREYETGAGRAALTGWSLDRVLNAAGVDPYLFGDVEVAGAGLSVTLDRDEIVDSRAFADGPPVFWMQDGVSRFLRPASASGAATQVGGGGPITIRVSRPSRLSVSATASKRRVEPGDPVTFTASVDGAAEGEPVDVSWYFDDGRRATGTRVTHRFRRPGTYDVAVGARTASDNPGADDFVTVRVGKPPDGPDRKGGGTNPDANAPDSGAATGPSAAGGSGSGTAGSPGGGAEDGATSRDRTAPAQRAAGRRRAAEPERAERRERRDRGAVAGAQEVSGIELADLSPLSSEAGRDALQAARRGRLRDEDDGSGAAVPPAVWWTLGAAFLVGLGGWRETRSRPTGRPA